MNKTIWANKPFLFILFTAFLSILGIGLIIPVLPFIIDKYIDPSQVQRTALYIGLLTSLYAFCQFFAAPVLGALSDKYGRRPVLLFCLLGSAIGYIMFGIGGSLAILFIARAIDGITGGDISTAMAYVADVTKSEERGQYFGVIGATVGLSFIIGPSIGGLTAKLSLSAPFYLAAGLTIISMLFGLFILPESLATDKRMTDFTWKHLNPFAQLAHVFRNNLLRAVLLIGFFYFITLGGLTGISSVFLKDILNWGASNIGFYFLLLGIGDIVTQGFISGKLLPRFGVTKTAFWGFILVGIAFSLNTALSFIHSAPIAYVYILIYALGSGLFEPAYNGLMSSLADPSEQGRTQGASQSVQSITRIVGPLATAFLYQYSHALPWLALIVCVAIGATLLVKNTNLIKEHAHGS